MKNTQTYIKNRAFFIGFLLSLFFSSSTLAYAAGAAQSIYVDLGNNTKITTKACVLEDAKPYNTSYACPEPIRRSSKDQNSDYNKLVIDCGTGHAHCSGNLKWSFSWMSNQNIKKSCTVITWLHRTSHGKKVHKLTTFSGDCTVAASGNDWAVTPK